MKLIRLSQHAKKQCFERGANESEVIQAIQTGICKSAKKGRYRYETTFQYNAQWQGRFYALKKVTPIVIETDTELIVITVYTFYF
jgi:hypothetical protein